MVFVKHNFLKSDIFFNPIFPGFSESRFFRVQVFQGLGPGSGSKVQGLGPGFRSSPLYHRKENLTVIMFFSILS